MYVRVYKSTHFESLQKQYESLDINRKKFSTFPSNEKSTILNQKMLKVDKEHIVRYNTYIQPFKNIVHQFYKFSHESMTTKKIFNFYIHIHILYKPLATFSAGHCPD